MGARPSSFVREEKPVVPTREWSAQQGAIFVWFEHPMGSKSEHFNSTSNLVVRARAGTGKTTTIIEGVNRAPENSILLCAFNKRIADELNTRITNPRAEAKTLHALGYQAIRRQWRGMPVAAAFKRGDQITNAAVAEWKRQALKRWKVKEKGPLPEVPKSIRSLVSQLHTKGRDMIPLSPTIEEVTRLMYFFDLTPDEGWGIFDDTVVAQMALWGMQYAAAQPPTYDVGIDYADMIYLPLVWQLLTPEYELVVVDEAQDLTAAQLEIARRLCLNRTCVVGDDRQAIYAFRGADSGSLDRLKEELKAEELPLTTTYRCGQEIVNFAQTIVPDIMAGPANPAGEIHHITYGAFVKGVQPGDFVLSRINAPLASATLRLLRENKRAVMAGRDIGKGIQTIVDKFRLSPSTPIEIFLEKLEDWETKQTTRLAIRGQLALVDRVKDQAATLGALTEDANTVGELLQRLATLFTDDPTVSHVLLSSVHKAKGLERDRVFIFDESLYCGSDTHEESNIEYVAVTRAKTQLFRVTGVPTLSRRCLA